MAFVNLNRWLDLNRDKGEEMGDTASRDANKAVTAAESGIRRVAAGYGQGDEQSLATAGTEAGAMLGKQGGIAGYLNTEGRQASALDEAMAGRSQSVQQARGRASNLQAMLQQATASNAARQQAQVQQRQSQADQWNAQQQKQAQAEQDRRMREQAAREREGRISGYRPMGADEYAEYSDRILRGYR